IVNMLENGENSLAVYNAPTESKEFKLFLNNFLLNKKLYINGRWYTLPPNIIFYSLTKKYDLTIYDYEIVRETDIKQTWDYEANEITYYHFLKNYQCHDNLLNKLSGWIKASNDKVMEIYVTDTFPDACWAQLLDKAKK